MLQDTRTIGATHIHQKYRPDVDGLRAIAVLIVVLGHAGFSAFSGGFIGVDIFFVISGFVVVNSIMGDLSRGSFSFKAFYARRARRLAPALYIVLIATFGFSILFMFPEDTFKLAKNILAVATMTSNIYLSKQTGYFDAQAADQPLLHTWSLSVEEQFYLVLPVLPFVLRRRSKTMVFWVLLSAALASFGLAVISRYAGTPGAYYFAQNRAFEFLAGVLLAVIEKERQVKQGFRTAVLARRADADSTPVRQGGATPPAQRCGSPVKQGGLYDALMIAGLAVVGAGVMGEPRRTIPGIRSNSPMRGCLADPIRW